MSKKLLLQILYEPEAMDLAKGSVSKVGNVWEICKINSTI